MTQVSATKDRVMFRMSSIVGQLMENNRSFQEELDREQILEILSNLLETVDIERISLLDEEELIHRVDRLMATELVYGMLEDLTPEQMEQFDAVVEGR